MSYAEILKNYIKKSNKTLEQISNECSVKGLQVTKSYISKIRSGKMPAPSDEVTKVLSDVLNADYEDLILASYLEKIPEPVQKILLKRNSTDIGEEEIRLICREEILSMLAAAFSESVNHLKSTRMKE
jgi:transcriptional regulator with XRE-family HTH domain